MSCPHLPAEILYLAIDILAADEDKTSLLNVALVSSILLNYARSHLFHTIDLDPRLKCPLLNARNYGAFDELLRKSTGIQFHVREIAIGRFDVPDYHFQRRCCVKTPNEHIIDSEHMKQCFVAKMKSFQSITTMLPRLTRFSINRSFRTLSILRWSRLPVTSEKAITKFCQQESISSLSLTSLLDVPASLIFSILKLDHLTYLRLGSITVDKADLSPLAALEGSSLKNLQHFWLVPDPVQFEDNSAEYRLDKIGNLILQAARKSLVSFRWYVLDLPPVTIHVAIGTLRNLKTISLRLDQIPYSIGIGPLLDEIAKSHCPTIEIIELLLLSSFRKYEVAFEKDDWAKFDDILQQPAFSKLSELRIALQYMPHDLDQVVQVIQSILPRTCARGIPLVPCVSESKLSTFRYG